MIEICAGRCNTENKVRRMQLGLTSTPTALSLSFLDRSINNSHATHSSTKRIPHDRYKNHSTLHGTDGPYK